MCEKIEIGLRRCGHCVLGIENDVNPIVSGAGYRNVCHGRFSPKVAEHLHSSSKNTKKKKKNVVGVLFMCDLAS